MLPTTRFCHCWLLVHSSMSPDFSSLSAKTYFISRGLSLLFKSSQLDSERSSSGTLTSAAPTSILRFFLFHFVLFVFCLLSPLSSCPSLSHMIIHLFSKQYRPLVVSAWPRCKTQSSTRACWLGVAGWE